MIEVMEITRHIIVMSLMNFLVQGYDIASDCRTNWDNDTLMRQHYYDLVLYLMRIIIDGGSVGYFL